MATKFPTQMQKSPKLEQKWLVSRVTFMVSDPWSSFWLQFLARLPPWVPRKPSRDSVRKVSVLLKAQGRSSRWIKDVRTSHWLFTSEQSRFIFWIKFILREYIYFHVFRKVQPLWKFTILFSLCYWFSSVNDTFCLLLVGTSLLRSHCLQPFYEKVVIRRDGLTGNLWSKCDQRR